MEPEKAKPLSLVKPIPPPVCVDLRTGREIETPERDDVDLDALAQIAFEAFTHAADVALLWVELTHDGRRPWLAVAKAARDAILTEERP
jgi:hypothetical protein